MVVQCQNRFQKNVNCDTFKCIGCERKKSQKRALILAILALKSPYFFAINIKKICCISPDSSEEGKDIFRSFRARISPTDNQAAEDELKKEIK